MTDDKEPDRPAQVVLDDAICDAIKRAMHEWQVTQYDVCGVLSVILARYTHIHMDHSEEDD